MNVHLSDMILTLRYFRLQLADTRTGSLIQPGADKILSFLFV